MTGQQEADALALLAQGASISEVAEMIGVSDWHVAKLIRPCRVVRHRNHEDA